jgi:hypothetical protein
MTVRILPMTEAEAAVVAMPTGDAGPARCGPSAATCRWTGSPSPSTWSG